MTPPFFGFSFSHLPDFLLDHTLLGTAPEERIGEHWQRWSQLVAGLWRPNSDATHLLRFDLDLPKGAIEVSWFYRAPQHQEDPALEVRGLARQLEAFGLEPRPMSDGEVLQKRRRLECYAHCHEVRQEERLIAVREAEELSQLHLPDTFITSRRAGDRLLYAVLPWWGPGDSFLVPFNTLAAQQQWASVCVLLQPTRLSDHEDALLASIARESESLAQMQTKPLSGTGNITLSASQNKTDPQLRFWSRVYAANHRRLMHPFLASVFCFANKPEVSHQLAATLAGTLHEELAFSPPPGESESLPTGAEIVDAGDIRPSEGYGRAALRMCRDLDFRWAESNFNHSWDTSGQLRRIRYLTDARGAATVFRFPVCVRGGLPGIAVRQRPPDFHPGPRLESAPGHMDLGRFHVGGRAHLPLASFAKHALITGFTGSGKSNTVLYLLHQLWADFQVPFLVIESAKKEYRGLIGAKGFENNAQGVPQLRIYTLGNESCAPLRFNPFELIPGTRVEPHLSRLQTCFEAALPPVGPLPSILSEALERLYRRFGWNLTDEGPSNPATDAREFPMISDFYAMVQSVIAARGYVGEVQSNIEAAVKGRIRPLLMGSKGLTFGQRRSSPNADELFSHPVILELNDLNANDKSLIVMFFLSLLREYRENHPVQSSGAPGAKLAHVTVVEEAHNVLSNTDLHSGGGEDQSDVRAKAVQEFCNMITEVRAYGEGLIIADQSPEKLARDAMRNTNVQIAHQLRDAHDREAVGKAMIMDQEQCDYVGKLPVGRAALFYTGLEKATFIDVPSFKDKPHDPEVEDRFCGFVEWKSPREADEAVKNHMKSLTAHYQSGTPFDCSLCSTLGQCRYSQPILKAAQSIAPQFEAARQQFTAPQNARQGSDLLSEFAVLLDGAASQAGFRNDGSHDEVLWCLMMGLWQRESLEPLNPKLQPLFQLALQNARKSAGGANGK